MGALRYWVGAVLLLASWEGHAATISGHITQSNGGAAIAGADVIAIRTSDFEIQTQQSSAVDGAYTLTVPAGDYVISTSKDGFVTEVYDNLPCPPCDGDQATVITVSVSQVITGIDFALDVTHPISGVIRRAGTLAAAEGIFVTVELTNGDTVGTTLTDALGQYHVGAANGTYRVRVASGSGLLGQYFTGVPCNVLGCDPTGATTITVTGSAVSGIDFTLQPGGVISGTLRRKSDNALLDVASEIELYKADGSPLISPFQTFTPDYQTAEPLPSGSYRIVARPEATYLPKVWNDRPCGGVNGTTCDPASGDPVVVTAGATTANVDFALVASTATIAGHVTAFVGGAPLAGVTISARREADALTTEGLTGADGSFLLEVPFGNYTVRAIGAPPLAEEAYPNVQCVNTFTCGGVPDVLALSGGIARTGIDFALAPAGSITIGVRDGDSNALIQAELKVLLPGFDGPRQFFSNGASATTVPVLSGGQVRLAARNNGDGCGPAPINECLGELYPGAPCPNLQCDLALGDAVNVGKGGNVSGIELVLGKGANIAGQVRASGSLDPIAGAPIEIIDSNGVVVGGAATDAGGNYVAIGLGSNAYFARTRTANFLDKLYDNLPCPGGACSPVAGTAINTTVGQTAPGIDFVLEPGATIAGKVRSASSLQPIANATVTVFDQAGLQVALAATNPLGTFTTRALAAGSYRVRFDASGFDSLLYDGVSCTPASCNPASGTAVVLAPPANATGIDADLAGGASGAVKPKLVYLNACKPAGCVVTQGQESSINNTSSIIQGTKFLPPFPFSDALLDQVVQCVRTTFSSFYVNVTTTDPGTAKHREFMFTTSPAVVGMGPQVGGVSPWACGVPLENSIAFGFATATGENVADLCNVAAHEIGHQLGLDHEFYCPDHMTYLEGCGQKAFADFDAQCGTYSPEGCYCGDTPTQNTFEKLAAVAGLSTLIFSDGFDSAPAAFFLGKRLGPQTSGSISCGTDTLRPSAMQPWPFGNNWQ